MIDYRWLLSLHGAQSPSLSPDHDIVSGGFATALLVQVVLCSCYKKVYYVFSARIGLKVVQNVEQRSMFRIIGLWPEVAENPERLGCKWCKARIIVGLGRAVVC